MPAIKVKNQAELDKALKTITADDWIVCVGNGRFEFSGYNGLIRTQGTDSPTMVAWGSSSPRMVAWDSSSPTMEAWDSSSPRMEAWESSSPRMVARGSSSPTMVAWGSSSPTMVARDSSSPTMEAWDSSSPTMEARESSSPRMVARGSSSPRMVAWESSSPRMEARGGKATGRVGKYASMTIADNGGQFDIPGAVILPKPPEIDNIEEWLDYWGVEVKRGIVTLYKAVDDNYISSRDFAYTPGTKPKCPDWEPHNQCGNGLHLTAHPSISRSYKLNATKYVAVPVRVEDLIVCHPGSRSDKVKAPEAAKPVFEVDRNGEPVESAQKEAKHD